MTSNTSICRPGKLDRLRWITASFGCVILIAGGCGSGGLPLVKVAGKVTFDGGLPPAAGRISFQPLDVSDDQFFRPAHARFDTDGVFSATSFKQGDGLLPGNYRVKVSCDQGLPNPNSPTPWEDITMIGPDYEPETITVAPGTPINDLVLDVPSKR